MKCKHTGARNRSLVMRIDSWSVWIDVNQCVACQEWLPLGPANDGGEHAEAVAVEKRAAELALLLADADSLCDWTFGNAPFGSDEERRGWSIAESNMQNHSNEWQAGYLARCIATHDASNGGG